MDVCNKFYFLKIVKDIILQYTCIPIVHLTSGVGFSVEVFDGAKFGFYRFQRFLKIVFIVI